MDAEEETLTNLPRVLSDDDEQSMLDSMSPLSTDASQVSSKSTISNVKRKRTEAVTPTSTQAMFQSYLEKKIK